MRPGYIRVELGDSDDAKTPSFIISPSPFVWHYGEILLPKKREQKHASSYAELCRILSLNFHIPNNLIPPAKYFKPTPAEKREECWAIYRTVPEGTGEPEWRMRARQAIIALLEDDDSLFEKGHVSVNAHICSSLEELQEELEAVAWQSG